MATRFANTNTSRLMRETHREQSDYRASKRETKLRPRPRGIHSQGSGADWHFRRDTDHLWVGELGREYDRNTPVGARLLNVLEQNVLQDSGFSYKPNTGDEAFDEEAKHYIDELFCDPLRIDLQGEYTHHALAKMVLRDTYAAGDIFALFNVDGPIDLRESHLCRQPSRRGVKHKNNVLGVELSDNRSRLGFWFTKQPISPFENHRILQQDLNFVPAWSEGDWKTRNVLHVRDPKRITQTRGVSVFAPVFDYLGILEDCQFQQLVKQQLANMFLIKRERVKEFNTDYLSKKLPSGPDYTPAAGEAVDRLLEELYPGAELQGLPGETVDLLSANIPSNEWFEHMRLVLRIIGVTLGLPYVLLMLDTADTNFHGYRGAVVEAREAFRNTQRWLARVFHTPCVEHYLHRWADEDPSVGRARERSLREMRRRRSKNGRFNFLRHSFIFPGWPSVDDLKDAQADTARLATSTIDRYKLAQRNDATAEEQNQRVVDGNRHLWMLAIAAATEDLADAGQKNPPIELVERWASRYAPMPIGDRVSLSMNLQEAGIGQQGALDD